MTRSGVGKDASACSGELVDQRDVCAAAAEERRPEGSGHLSCAVIAGDHSVMPGPGACVKLCQGGGQMQISAADLHGALKSEPLDKLRNLVDDRRRRRPIRLRDCA